MKKILFSVLLIALVPTVLSAEKSLIESIEKSGGLILPWPGEANSWEVEFHLRGRELTDDGLANVASLKSVIALNLRDTQITSAGLLHLKALSKLKRLHLERTKIDDSGINHLAGLQNLEYLNLYGTKITDKALEQLKDLKNLKQLYVWQTEVTDAGVEELEKSLPNLKVVRGIDLSKIVIVKKPVTTTQENLKWMPEGGTEKPPAKSKPGSFTIITFQNDSNKNTKLYWIDYGGSKKLYGEIAKGQERKQNTYSDAVWLITDDKEKPLGYFVAGTKEALAIIPK